MKPFFNTMKLIVSLLFLWTALCISVTLAVSNGHKALNGQFPYQAYIYDSRRFCGATIIHKRWLLTAGHCKSGFNDMFQYAIMSSVFIHGTGGKRIGVEKFIRHEKFEYHDDGVTEIVFYDVGLVRLNKDIEFSDTIKLIKLAKDDTIRYENVTATISGWGILEKPGYHPLVLQYAKVPVITDEECEKATANKHIFNNGICTLAANNITTCNGDSGSPMTYEDMLIGIASTGDLDCKFVVPSIYARVKICVRTLDRATIESI